MRIPATKLNPYTGNPVHSVVWLRKEVNGNGFAWHVVVWECQYCRRTHGSPSWACPSCGGYVFYLTPEEYELERKRQENASRRRHAAAADAAKAGTEDRTGTLVHGARAPDEPGPTEH